jgi:hypothetical protein
MLSWLKGLIFGKDLQSELLKKKRVRVNGFKFTIKKISPLDHLTGSKVMLQAYDVLKLNNTVKNQEEEISQKKIKEHLKDVLLAGVVEPALVSKESDNGVYIESMFVDMDLVNKLYAEIISFTYGKKKILARR